MQAKGLSEAAIGAFKRNFDQLVAGVTGLVRRARDTQRHAAAAARGEGGRDDEVLEAETVWVVAARPPAAGHPGVQQWVDARAQRTSPPSVQVAEEEIEAVAHLPELASLPAVSGNVQVGCGAAAGASCAGGGLVARPANPCPWPRAQALLKATAVLKLNGGLGTSMGLEKAKSLLAVKDGKTFLDLIAEQVKFTRREHGSAVKFILMNSFSTSADTRAFLAKAHQDLLEVRRRAPRRGRPAQGGVGVRLAACTSRARPPTRGRGRCSAATCACSPL
jgi:hypothetical protein